MFTAVLYCADLERAGDCTSGVVKLPRACSAMEGQLAWTCEFEGCGRQYANAHSRRQVCSLSRARLQLGVYLDRTCGQDLVHFSFPFDLAPSCYLLGVLFILMPIRGFFSSSFYPVASACPWLLCIVCFYYVYYARLAHHSLLGINGYWHSIHLLAAFSTTSTTVLLMNIDIVYFLIANTSRLF